ncbi:Galactose-specific lectin nattectin [Holothuria leucospilota]|uniref:Galactose-specific lectin nattectin n=1 Tax=Holothuria leucospilota TaxID=206669 RepID=A0A9Q0YF54_HOLLE|nr:Galactose-specific lectin nattectin [Holothuria leucospilota]
MEWSKLESVFLVIGILISPFVFAGQCSGVKKEKDYVVFPKAFFSSNADQLKTFLTRNSVIDVPQWYHWNDSYYTFVSTTEMTWEDAANACSSMRVDAHLVFIESELENKDVSRLAKVASEGRNNRWWIGLTDRVTEGVWKWYNVSLNYNNWRQGQPDNSGKNEDCGELGFRWNGDNAFWNDAPCTEQKKFICESGLGNDL